MTKDDASEPPARRTPLYAVLAANAVSQVGDMMVAVAMPWFVLETTGSIVNMGLTGAVVGVGALVSSVAGGPLVDRVGLRTASVISDVTAGAAVVAIPLLYAADMLAFWQFLVLAFLVSVANPPGDLARRALIPSLARWAAMPLERANAADTAIPRLAQLAGPVLGGILIAIVGAPTVLVINAATFFVSAALVAVGIPRPATAQPADEHRRRDTPGRDDGHVFANPGLIRNHARRYVADLAQGLRFVWANGLILTLAVIVTVANLLEKPLMSVVAPVYADTFFGSPASFGAMLSAFGAGALAGTILFGVVGPRLPHRLTFITCMVVAPALLFGALAATPPLPVVLGAVALSGLVFGPMNTLFATAVQQATPAHMLGRVFGTITAFSMIGIPVGAVLVGVVVERFGLVPTLVGMGAIYVATAAGMSFNPALRGMDTPVVQQRGDQAAA